MGTGAADSWYHEKESAWPYGQVAAEDQAACWLGLGKLLGASLS
jgi:hypothetical protein